MNMVEGKKRKRRRPFFSIELKAFRGTIEDLKAANSNAYFETVTSENELRERKKKKYVFPFALLPSFEKGEYLVSSVEYIIPSAMREEKKEGIR
jgi:hypothetical protein